MTDARTYADDTREIARLRNEAARLSRLTFVWAAISAVCQVVLLLSLVATHYF